MPTVSRQPHGALFTSQHRRLLAQLLEVPPGFPVAGPWDIKKLERAFGGPIIDLFSDLQDAEFAVQDDNTGECYPTKKGKEVFLKYADKVLADASDIREPEGEPLEPEDDRILPDTPPGPEVVEKTSPDSIPIMAPPPPKPTKKDG